MGFFSFNFLVFVSALLLLFYARRGTLYRRAVVTIGNAVFLLSFAPPLPDLLALAALAGGGYAMLAAVGRWPSRTALALSVGTIVVVLLFIKRYWFLTLVAPSALLIRRVEIVGVSYFSFKLIHMLVDRREGTLAPYTLLSYLNYQLGFVSLVAGPIQRYNDFHDFWWGIETGGAVGPSGLHAWNRLLNGLLKLGVLATAAIWLFARFEEAALSGQAAGLMGMFYTYPAYVYWNFAGYCDIVIAVASLLGLKQPENFNRPYLSRNLIDFWNRWHITLSQWIRDYVFMTSYRAIARRRPPGLKWIGYALLCGALLLAGVWHGPGSNFLVFGLLHGLGVAVCQVYTDTLHRRLGRAGVERYSRNRWIHAVALVLTVNYVCLTFVFFRPQTAATVRTFVERTSRS